MAEAIGIASGVVGLINFGIDVCKGLVQYYESYKDAESDIKATCDSVSDLGQTLPLMESHLDKLTLTEVTPEALQKVQSGISLCQGGISHLKK
ncbi:hypothetical protein QQX98_010017, partial [Neonectria punicea]